MKVKRRITAFYETSNKNMRTLVLVILFSLITIAGLMLGLGLDTYAPEYLGSSSVSQLNGNAEDTQSLWLKKRTIMTLIDSSSVITTIGATGLILTLLRHSLVRRRRYEKAKSVPHNIRP